MSGFDKQTRAKLYNDTKNIITTYFINSKNDNLEEYNIDNDDIDDFFNTVKLNFNLVKLLELKNILRLIETQLRRDIKIENIDSINSIRGRLDMHKFIKYEYFKVHTKKVFPCKVLNEDYNTIENEFVVLVVRYALNLINNIPTKYKDFIKEFNKSIYYKKLEILNKDLKSLLYNGEFKSLLENNHLINSMNIGSRINKILPIVEQKIKRKEISTKSYGILLNWWKSISKGITDIDKIPLLLYTSTFDDKLFEIWLIEKIKESFINSFGLEIDSTISEVGKNPLWKRNETYIYRLKYKTDKKESIIKIYFQKSKDLIWNNENRPKWIICDKEGNKTSKYLQGNLDIIITCDDCKEFDPVFIDAKNMYYHKVNNTEKEEVDPVVSEKVYKMVGYLDNFNKVGQRHGNCLGILIMKNKKSEFKIEREYKCDNNNSKISIFSIDIEPLSIDCSIIAKYILENLNSID